MVAAIIVLCRFISLSISALKLSICFQYSVSSRRHFSPYSNKSCIVICLPPSLMPRTLGSSSPLLSSAFHRIQSKLRRKDYTVQALQCSHLPCHTSATSAAGIRATFSKKVTYTFTPPIPLLRSVQGIFSASIYLLIPFLLCNSIRPRLLRLPILCNTDKTNLRVYNLCTARLPLHRRRECSDRTLCSHHNRA